MNDIASVAMIGGSRMIATRNPFISPTTTAIARQITDQMMIPPGAPLVYAVTRVTFRRTTVAPADRSNPPDMSTMHSPTAAKAIARVLLRMISLSWNMEKKFFVLVA